MLNYIELYHIISCHIISYIMPYRIVPYDVILSILYIIYNFTYIIKFVCRWKPFRRSAYIRQQDSRIMDQPTDKKFFGALIKPKPVKQTLDSSTTGEMIQGAVFRALPVYRVGSFYQHLRYSYLIV